MIKVSNWCEAELAEEMTVEQAKEIVVAFRDDAEGCLGSRSAGHFVDAFLVKYPNLARHQRAPLREYHYSRGFYDTQRTTFLDSVDFGTVLHDIATQIRDNAA